MKVIHLSTLESSLLFSRRPPSLDWPPPPPHIPPHSCHPAEPPRNSVKYFLLVISSMAWPPTHTPHTYPSRTPLRPSSNLPKDSINFGANLPLLLWIHWANVLWNTGIFKVADHDLAIRLLKFKMVAKSSREAGNLEILREISIRGFRGAVHWITCGKIRCTVVAASDDTVRRRTHTHARARPILCPFPRAQLLPKVPLMCPSGQKPTKEAVATARISKSCSSSEPRSRALRAGDSSSRRQRERHCGTAPSR